MAQLDIFGEKIKPEVKETKIKNDNFDFFNITPEEKVEEDTKIVESFDDFVLNIKKNPEQEVCYKRFDHPVYFGKTFEYLKTWEPGVVYYNSDYVQSFVSYKNCLLACLITHESTNSLEPIIELNNEGYPVAVKNAYWYIVMSGDMVESDYSDVLSKLNEVQNKLDNISNNVNNQNTAIDNMSKQIIDNNNLVKDLNVNVESNTDRIKIIENKIAGDIAYPWIGSEFEYEQLAVKDPNKFYYLYEE